MCRRKPSACSGKTLFPRASGARGPRKGGGPDDLKTLPSHPSHYKCPRPLFIQGASCAGARLCRPGGHGEGPNTRSHPELGRENPQRRWYCRSSGGRVGRRQARMPPISLPSNFLAFRSAIAGDTTVRRLPQLASDQASEFFVAEGLALTFHPSLAGYCRSLPNRRRQWRFAV